MERTIKNINLVYYMLYMTTVVVAVIIFFLTFSNAQTTHIDEKSQTGIIISSVYILYLLISIPYALWSFHKKTKKWQQIKDQYVKLVEYEKGSKLRLWIIGAGLIAGIVLVYFMRSKSMIFCAAIAAIALYFTKPTLNKMISELKLDEDREDEASENN
ncbi:MAG TPA: hypothetical protein PKH58_11205 [Paludibacteraceae bacterium]|nr:hypothetical protein [Paludibacteraceae bacterium]